MSSPLRSTLLYGAGSMLARVISFAMLPIYTHYVAPAEYAKLQLVLMTVEILAIAVSTGTTAGFMRFFYKASDARGRNQVVFSALMLNLMLNVVGSVILLVFAKPLAALVLSSAEDADLFRILAGCFTLEALIGVPLLHMQAEHKPALFVAATLSRTVLSASLNLVFLIVLGLGVRGILISTLIAHSLLGFAAALWTLRQTGWSWSGEAIRQLRRFGIPYQIAAAGSFILTYGDRYVLKASRPLAEVGLYAFGYQFGFLLWSVTAAPIFLTWTPLRHQQLGTGPTARDEANRQGFLYLNLIVVSAAVVLALAVGPTIALLTPPAYHTAAAFVPIVLAAYIVHSWSEAAQFGIDAAEQTRYATIAFWIATVATVALYLTLIPPFGAFGAAIATLLGFLVRFILTVRFAQRLTPLAYGWVPVFQVVATGALVVILGQLIAVQGVPAGFAAAAVLSAVYGVIVWTQILKPADRAHMGLVVHQIAARLWPTYLRGRS